MNWYFYKIFLPLVFLWTVSFIAMFTGHLSVSWVPVLISWFFIGPIGIGVGYHRLFSHRQFVTARWVELTLALLGTLAAYAPVLFWASNHQYHHKHSDETADPSSPSKHGFFESFLWYRLRQSTLQKVDIKNYCTRKILIDPQLRWLSRHFTKIIWGTMLVLLLFGFPALVNYFLLPAFLEHARINIVSSVVHMKSFPGNYRNHITTDESYNNLVLGFLTMGFAWHNNHHAHERQLNLREKWWELDIEGLIGKALDIQDQRRRRASASSEDKDLR